MAEEIKKQEIKIEIDEQTGKVKQPKGWAQEKQVFFNVQDNASSSGNCSVTATYNGSSSYGASYTNLDKKWKTSDSQKVKTDLSVRATDKIGNQMPSATTFSMATMKIDQSDRKSVV